MRVVVDAKLMSSVMNSCCGAVLSRTPVPAYTCVMLDADAAGKRFEVLVARDGSLLRWYVPGADVQRSGKIVVDPNRPAALLSELEGDVTLSSDGKGGELSMVSPPFFEASVSSKVGVDEFPWASPPVLGNDLPYVTVDRAEFLRVVRLCYCSSRTAKDFRYVMDGVSFWPLMSNGKVTSIDVVGTDGRAIIRSNLACSAGGGELKERSFASPSLLHNSFVSLLDGIFGGDPSESLCLAPGADAVVIQTARSSLRCACGNGSYPDYLDIIRLAKRDKPIVFDVVASDFVHCLRVASICCADTPAVEVVLGEGTLTASSVVTGELVVGRSRHEMPIAIDGGGAKFRLSPKVFFNFAAALKEASMIKFAVNLKRGVAFFSCEDISIDGVLVLLS